MVLSVCWRAVEIFGVLASQRWRENRCREAAFAWICAAECCDAEPLLTWPLPLAAPSAFNWLFRPGLGSLVDDIEANRVLLRFWAARALFEHLVALQRPSEAEFAWQKLLWGQTTRFEALQEALHRRQFREACILSDIAQLRTILGRLQVVLQDNQALRTTLQRPEQRLDALQLLLHIHAMRIVISVMMQDWTGARQAISDGLRALEVRAPHDSCSTDENRSAWRSHFWLEWIRVANLEGGLDMALNQCVAAEAAGADPNLLDRARQEIRIAMKVSEWSMQPERLDIEGFFCSRESSIRQQNENLYVIPQLPLWNILGHRFDQHQGSNTERLPCPKSARCEHSQNEKPSRGEKSMPITDTRCNLQSMGPDRFCRNSNWPDAGAQNDLIGMHVLGPCLDQNIGRNVTQMDGCGGGNDMELVCAPLGPSSATPLSMVDLFSVASAADHSARMALQRYELTSCARSLVSLAATAYGFYQWGQSMPASWPWTKTIRDAGQKTVHCVMKRAAAWYKLIQRSDLREKLGLHDPESFAASSVDMMLPQATNETFVAPEAGALDEHLRIAAALERADRLIEAKTLLEPWLCNSDPNLQSEYAFAAALCLQAQILFKLGIFLEKAVSYLELAEVCGSRFGYRYISHFAKQLRIHISGAAKDAERANEYTATVERTQEELWSSLVHDTEFSRQLTAALNWAASVSKQGLQASSGASKLAREYCDNIQRIQTT
jgi:hypothetical protein